jgi:hypothetical protein
LSSIVVILDTFKSGYQPVRNTAVKRCDEPPPSVETGSELSLAVTLKGMPIAGATKEVLYGGGRFDLLDAPPEIFDADLAK